MGFRQGAFAKIWSVKNEGKYSTANVSISKKNPDTNEYVTEFQHNFVRLVGKAHEMAQGIQESKNGTTVKITSCDVNRIWDAKTQKEFTNFTIFGIEFPDGNATPAKPNTNNKPAEKTGGFMNIPDGIDEELPFN